MGPSHERSDASRSTVTARARALRRACARQGEVVPHAALPDGARRALWDRAMDELAPEEQPAGMASVVALLRRRWLRLLLIVGGTLAVALLGQELLRELLVVPLLWVLWAIGALLEMFSEISYWWVFVLLCVG